jgi:hypothetical protein
MIDNDNNNNNINQDSGNKNEEVVEKMEKDEGFNNTNHSQDVTLKNEKITEANDTITDGEEKDISNQETFRAEEELVTTERVEGGYNILAMLCGNSKVKTVEENSISKYLNSNDLKKSLSNSNLKEDNMRKVIDKLKDYLKRYEASTITLTKLKQKYNTYFLKFKSCNQSNIEKKKDISENIDKIKESIFSYIQEEENKSTNTFDTQTFGRDINSPRNNDNDNDKSCLDIPTLDMSFINNNDTQENPFAHNSSQNTNRSQTDNFVNSPNNQSNRDNTRSWTIECNNSSKNSDKSPLQDQYQGLRPYQWNQLSKDELYTMCKKKFNSDQQNTSEKNIAKHDTLNDDLKMLEVRLYVKIYTKTFGYKISPSMEKLIVDLVLETEQYIEKVRQIVTNYKISNIRIKNKILKEVNESTSKEMVESHLNKSTIGKKILKLIQGQKQEEEVGQKQEEEVKNSYLTKLLSKANKIYKKAYNKYEGYDNLSEEEIDKIAEYVYKKHYEEKLKEDIYIDNIKNKPSNNDLEDIKGMDEFVKTKGFTVENCDSKDFHEISHQGHQSLTVQPLDDDDVTAYTTPGYCDLNCYTVAAASALVYAISYMLAFDNEVSHTGFGPSGF